MAGILPTRAVNASLIERLCLVSNQSQPPAKHCPMNLLSLIRMFDDEGPRLHPTPHTACNVLLNAREAFTAS